MSIVMVILCTFAAAALVGGLVLSIAYEAFLQYPLSVRERLQGLTGKTRDEKSSLLLDIKRLAESASRAPSDWRSKIRDTLEQSGLRVSALTLVGTSFGLGALGALAIGFGTQRWWTIPAGFALGLSAPWLYVCLQRRRRLRQLTLQLPHAFDVIARAVRAGQTVPSAFQMVADDFSRPICEEFRYCYEQQNLGISYDSALRNMGRGSGIMELRIFVIALLVQARSGGNLTELLQNLSTTVRKRLVMQQKVRALTGEGRMQAAVLIALPIVVFCAMYVLNPDYAKLLIERPWLLGGCVISQSVGALWISKMIRIEY